MGQTISTILERKVNTSQFTDKKIEEGSLKNLMNKFRGRLGMISPKKEMFLRWAWQVAKRK
jgi:hypothetical protein